MVKCGQKPTIASSLKAREVARLYHFTHHSNLASIITHGLLSHEGAQSLNYYEDISDPDVQWRRGRPESVYGLSIHRYVPLYIKVRNPMLYRRRSMQDDLVVLALDLAVADAPRVVFTDGNAAASPTKFYAKVRDLKHLDWKCLRADWWNDIEDGKRKRCAEFLIPDRIPFKRVKRIVVRTSRGEKPVRQVLGAAERRVKVRQRPKWFFDDG